jgi:ribosomal protein L25 (general stress protein Ctc)
LKLSRTEIRSITQFERGEALITNNNNKVPVVVKTNKTEQQMITTDRSELAALLNELEKNNPQVPSHENTPHPENESR